MAAPGGASPVRAYYIQHIQTGAEFRSAELSEVTQWMTAQNLAYIASVAVAGGGNSEEEGA